MPYIISLVLIMIVATVGFFVVVANNKEKRIRMLILPLIFIILLFVPGMIETALREVIQTMSDMLWQLYVVILFQPAFLIWTMLFYHIPLGIYIVMLVIYTAVSWRWIWKLKKGNAVYAIVWIVLCILSILLYWKIGELYHAMMGIWKLKSTTTCEALK